MFTISNPVFTCFYAMRSPLLHPHKLTQTKSKDSLHSKVEGKMLL